MKIEVWKPIVGYEGYYEVSDLGNIASVRTNHGNPRRRPVKPHVTHDGYVRANLSKDGVRGKKHVAHMVLEAFVGPRPPGMQACHGEGGQKCNELSNLRWDTPQSNYDDRTRAGTLRGSRHWAASIDEETARRIKIAASDRTRLARDIAEGFEVKVHIVRSIRNNLSWSWL